MGLRNHVLDGGEDRTNPFTAAMRDNVAMRPFAKLLRTLVQCQYSAWALEIELTRDLY